ncbi:MAG: sigma-54 dependent transcriptional regulator [Lentisphaeraceae bacterium]|nr:sigma-54 dependent transcriptional regulator [Lentisphaeraceae bacterium]
MAKLNKYINLEIEDLTSKSDLMLKCLNRAEKVAPTDIPVFIKGETGTGKTLLAQAIHNSSKRKSQEFISFNASAMSETLLESHLFGHEKGAFTGAVSQVKGKFELADNGSLFLDEVADMSLGAQAKILRAIEYGEFTRLGSEKIITSDARIISATHKDLFHLAEEEKFREDLIQRMSGVTLYVPSLRERLGDLPAMIANEVRNCAAAIDKTITSLHPDAFDKLMAHAWPGNLRELHRVIQVAVLFTDTDVIREEDVELDQKAKKSTSSDEHVEVFDTSDLSLDSAILRHVKRVFEFTNKNKSKTAKTLGVSRSTLDRKLEEME